MATHLKGVFVSCLLLLILMEKAKPVLAMKTVKKLAERLKELEECQACTKIKELNDTINELKEKVDSIPVEEYFKSCMEMRAHFPNAVSGLYSIQPIPEGKVITVYCEMAIAGGGFTFVPRTAIRGSESQEMIYELFTNRTQVLMRIQKKDVSQPYTLVEQLPEYKQHLLGALVNNFDGYTSPANSHLQDYLFLGILPPDVAGVDGKVLGFMSNGKALRYTNCGGNRNNLFAFLPDHSELPPSDAHSHDLIYEREGMAVDWRNTAVLPPSGRTMPNDFFFLTEIHMGGCGCYTSSDRWTDALGTAIGFR